MMNPMLRHLLFSSMKLKIKRSVKDFTLKNGEKAGELLSISYAVYKDETKPNICRTVFDNYSGDVTMTDKETKDFGKTLGVDIESEFKTYDTLFAKMDFIQKLILIKRTKPTGETENLSI